MATLAIERAGPLTTIQDDGRFGQLRHGIGASGPMDRGAYEQAGLLSGGGRGGIEITTAGLDLDVLQGECRVGLAGGDFSVARNGESCNWQNAVNLKAGDRLSITPGVWGNYGYLRFSKDIEVPLLMGSMATNSRVGLGGLDGRALRPGDQIQLVGESQSIGEVSHVPEPVPGPIRFIWGLHADLFAKDQRTAFVSVGFTISAQMDRMGVRLAAGAAFAGKENLSLVSDVIVPGDIQILGDGTPVALLRDHQPTGGYPRIATIISADLDRFVQLRPGTQITFEPVSVEHAHRLLRSAAK